MTKVVIGEFYMRETKHKESFNNNSNKYIGGLTDKQVLKRKKEGKINYIPKAPSRTMWQIVRANLFTSFNAINFILAVIVIIAGSPKNSLFIGVIISNTLIGVFQEVRAKETLEKLSVVNEAKAKVCRNGIITEINANEIVLDDTIYFENGMQILVDAEVIYSNGLEVDESMITGESDSVAKNLDSKLYSGSFVVAGEGYARAVNVGRDTYSSKLAQEAKKFKIINSELQKSINKIFKVLIWLIAPVSIILIVAQLKALGSDWREAVIGSVTGIVGMIPEGLVLLTSATFIVSVVKLSKYNTLVQELAATEVLARVDVICLDKTGTITEGKLKLAETKNIGARSDEEVNEILELMAHNLPSNNPTQKAILDKYPHYNSEIKCINKIPFSSKRKWGGAKFKNLGTWILGAPEIILKEKYKLIKGAVEEEAAKGKRVLLLANVCNNKLTEELNGKIENVALLIIEDIIRENAPQVLKYFSEEDVDVKIISGDNPVTVSEVAKKAGVKNSENYIDARELPDDFEELKKAVQKNSVFGRVTPHQKKKIVMALQDMGHTVAMTGDGVNDVLALKTSDCGIAMANGAEATKAVAQLVLMNSDFANIPKIVEEGRKQIQNVERMSELFLSKSIFSLMLSVITSILLIPYPIEPLQLSLIGSCAIGIPAFFLAMLPSTGRVEKGFLQKVLTVSIPNGILMAVFTLCTFRISQNAGADLRYSKTLALLMYAGVAIIVMVRVARPLTIFKIVLSAFMTGIIAAAFLTPAGRYVFSLSKIRFIHWMISLAVIAGSWPLITIIVDWFRVRVNRKYSSKIS